MLKTAIIGAGTTGLACAAALEEHGVETVVFEKSRGIGGRVATRRVTLDDGRSISFDHGAPALRPRSAEFAAFVDTLREKGAAAQWRHGLTVGTPGMRDMLGPLAHGLNIRFETRVDALVRVGRRWTLRLAPHEREGGRAEGEAGPFDRVVLAVPAHQARTLVAPVAPGLADIISSVRSTSCWTLMAAFEGAPLDIAERDPVPGVEWLVADSAKPGRDEALRTWTLQMDATWSARHLEAERDAVLPLLMDALRRRSGETGEPLIAMAHRWRYSQTATPLGEAYVESRNLFVGGDWALGACVEDAWRSGRAMAERLLSEG